MGMEGFGDFGNAFGGFSQFSGENIGGATKSLGTKSKNSFEEGLRAIEQERDLMDDYAGFSELPVEQSCYSRAEMSDNRAVEELTSTPPIELPAQKLESLIPQIVQKPSEEKVFQVPFKHKGGSSPPVTSKNQATCASLSKKKPAEAAPCQVKETSNTKLEEVKQAVHPLVAPSDNDGLPKSSTIRWPPQETIPQVTGKAMDIETKTAGPPTIGNIGVPTLPSTQQKLILANPAAVRPQMAPFALKMVSPKKEILVQPVSLPNRQAAKTPMISLNGPGLLKMPEVLHRPPTSIEAPKPMMGGQFKLASLPKEREQGGSNHPQSTGLIAKPQVRLGGVNMTNKLPASNFSFDNLGLDIKFDEHKKQVKLNPEVTLKLDKPQSIALHPNNLQDNFRSGLDFQDKIEPPRLNTIKQSLETTFVQKDVLTQPILSGPIAKPRPMDQGKPWGLSKTKAENMPIVVAERSFPHDGKLQSSGYQIFSNPAIEELNRAFKGMRADVLKVQEGHIKCSYLVKRISSLRSYIGYKMRDTDREISHLGGRL